jgi:hypothetical protein
MAKAHTDDWIELAVHPRYKENIERYMQVVQAVVIQESSAELVRRLGELEDDLLQPTKAARAAIQLEALGTREADIVLLKGLKAADRQVQFYAAEALAYRGYREAAEPLGRVAREESAFRMLALTALAVLDDPISAEQLHNLLGVPSVETRYGAFRALWMMNPDDPYIKGEQLGGQFSYHVLDTPGNPMVHLTRNRRAEVVLFGNQQEFSSPLAVNAGNQIMVTSTGPNEISVSKFSTTDTDQKRIVSARVDEVIRAIVNLGGTYPDVVQALQEAKAAGALHSRFEVETLPEGGRPYQPVALEGESTPPSVNEAKPAANKAGSKTPAGDKTAEEQGLWDSKGPS